MTHDPFSNSEAAIQAARLSHGESNPILRIGLGVPKRDDLLALSPQDLFDALDIWMWEGPAELIPSNEQVAAVREVVVSRDDASSPEIQSVLDALDKYLRI